MRGLVRCFGFVAAVAALLSTVDAEAAVKLPRVIGSNMVLQRDVELPIWGWADPGEEVTVEVKSPDALGELSAATTKKATADAAGKWSVKLPAMKAGGPHELTVSGKNAITLTNVLVGEVWVCSGQSNMEWSITQSANPQEELANANHPKIRLFHIPKLPAGEPASDVVADWKACETSTAGNFSAVAYYFGRKLQKELDVPIGLINTSWGGTKIEPWTPPVGFQAVESLQALAQQVEANTTGFGRQKAAALKQYADWLPLAQKAAAEGKDIPAPPAWPQHPLASSGTPTGLYNGMIAPIVPFAIRGAIWYQGESNLSDGLVYTEKMKALIAGWRSVWNQGDFPFGFVQLAPYRYGPNWEPMATLWESQTNALSIPNTGMAVITDIGNLGNIHPKNKQDVGLRLALWALATSYGKNDVEYFGPMFKAAQVEEEKVRVTFDHGAGLKTTNGEPPTWFEVAGADGKYVTADAKIDGEAVIVSSKEVAVPKSVRYGWYESQTPNLVNGAGLPANPFRSAK